MYCRWLDWVGLRTRATGVRMTHIVLQPLYEFDAVVAQVKLPQVAEALQALHLSDAITLGA